MKCSFLGLGLLLLPWAATAAEPRGLVVDEAHSQVTVAVKATVDSFTAILEHYEAAIQVDPAGRRVRTAVFRFKFADLKTGKPGRDAEMNTWEQSAQFPDARFTLTSLTPGTDGRLVAHGRLRLHGVERELTFPVSVTTDHTVFAVDAEAPFDTRNFGLPVIRKFALLKVDPVVTVRVHLQGNVTAP
ncbi:MAG: YceI family protein [Opitutales bacterium]